MVEQQQDPPYGEVPISFPALLTVVLVGKWEALGLGAHAVIDDAKRAGVYVFRGEIDESVAPVLLSADGQTELREFPHLQSCEVTYAANFGVWLLPRVRSKRQLT